MKKNSKRDSNIELLRIILIMFVIFEHYNNSNIGGGLANPNNLPILNYYLLNFIDSLSACAVNCFFIISGYFLYKCNSINLRKSIHIVFVYCMYRCFTYLLNVVIGESSFGLRHIVGSLVPNSYFALMYATIVLIAPFCNFLMEHLNSKIRTLFVILLILLFNVWPTIMDYLCSIMHISYTGLSNVTIEGNFWGYTITNFLTMYFLGSYIHHCKDENTKLYGHKALYDLFMYISITVLIFVSSFINKHAMNYCNILVVLQGAVLFMFFTKLKFKSNIINWLAQSVWGIYCIHLSILWFWHKFNIYQYVEKQFIYCIGNVFITSFSVITLCIILDKFYSILLIPVYKIADKISLLNKKIYINNDILS